MALPEDVTTFRLEFGPYYDAAGEPAFAGMTGKIQPSRYPILHTDGSVLVNASVPVTIDAFGEASIDLVHNDHGGGFTYSMVWDVASRRPSPGNKPAISVTSGTAVADFDELVESDQVPGVVVPRGPQGDSAYEVAVANGFVGNQAAWLASLKGPQGTAGVADDASVAALVPGPGLTSDALRAAFGGQLPSIYDSFASKSTGALSSLTADSGGAWNVSTNGATGAAPTVSGGAVTASVTAAGNAAWYAVKNAGAPVAHIGTQFSFPTAVSTLGGGVALGVFAEDITTLGSPPTRVPNSPCHVVIGPTSVALSIFTGGAISTIVSDPVSLATDGTKYRVDIFIDGNRMTVTLTDNLGDVIYTREVTHASIAAYNTAQFAFFEHFYNDAATDNRIATHAMWADVAAAAPPVYGKVVTKKRLVGMVAGLQSMFQPKAAMKVHTGGVGYTLTTTFAIVDGTNLAIVTQVGPTGQLLIEMDMCLYSASADKVFAAVDVNGGQFGTQYILGSPNGTGTSPGRRGYTTLLTGLPPYQTYTVKLMLQSANTNTTILSIDGNNPFVLKATPL